MKRALMLCLGSVLCAAPLAITIAHAADKPAAKSTYKAPRNTFGQPDLGETWSSATLTTELRPASAKALVYTPDEVKKLEDYAQMEIKAGNANTAADAPVNVNNGLELRPGFAAAGGTVGGYNRGWLDPGSQVMRVGGEPRTSIPDHARRPGPAAASPASPRQRQQLRRRRRPGGNSDNPENRTLGERCIIGFGRNAGPPMLPNGFYNNNYQFVQGQDAVAILVEMVHDAAHHPPEPPSTAPADCAPGSATPSATGRATPWSSRPPTSRRTPGLQRLVGEPEGHRALHPRRQGPAALPVHGRGPDHLGQALGRRVRVRRRQRAGLRIRLP